MNNDGKLDQYAIVLLVVFACVFLYPVFLGKILLPGDATLLMYPWRAHAAEKFPEVYQSSPATQQPGNPATRRFIPHNVLLDVLQQYYPWRAFAVESLRAGIIPLWNPYNFCGTPFVANGQSSVFYPPHVMFLIFGPEYGWGVSAILHLSLIGIATHKFLRLHGLRPIASFVGGATFMFCGFNVAWLEYPTVSLWTIAWLPVSLYFLERSFAQNADSRILMLCTGVTLGMQFLAGHLQSGFYVLFCFSTYAFYRILMMTLHRRASGTQHPASSIQDQSSTIRHSASSIQHLLVPLAIAFAIGAIQLLPSLELIKYNPRAAGKSYEDVIASALPARQLVALIVPNFFGTPVKGGIYWGHFNYIELCGYPGIVAIVLSLWGVTTYTRRPLNIPTYFIILIFFSLLIAIGSPVYRLFFLLPGFRQIAAVARVLVLFDFSIAVLAAYGINHLCDARNRPELRRHILAIFLGLMAIVAVSLRMGTLWIQQWAQGVFPGGSQDQIGDYVKLLTMNTLIACTVPTLWILVSCILVYLSAATTSTTTTGATALRPFSLPTLLLAASVVIDLFLFGITFNPTCPRGMLFFPTDSTRALHDRAGSSRLVTLAPTSARGFVECMPPNTNMLFGIRSAQGSDSLYTRWYSELFAETGSGVLQRDPKNIDARLLGLLGVRSIATPPNPMEQADIHVEENRDWLPRAFGINSSPFGKLIPVRSQITPIPIEHDATNSVTLKCNSNHGWAVLCDGFFPGWRVYANGKPTQIDAAYGALRFTQSHEGSIRHVYESRAFLVGGFISLFVFSLTIGGGVSEIVKRSTLQRDQAR